MSMHTNKTSSFRSMVQSAIRCLFNFKEQTRMYFVNKATILKGCSIDRHNSNNDWTILNELETLSSQC